MDVCIISFDDEQVYRRLYHIIWRWTSIWTFVSYHLTMNKSMDVCIISFDDEQVYRRLYHIIWRWTSLWTFVSYHLTMNKYMDVCIISFDDEQVYEQGTFVSYHLTMNKSMNKSIDVCIISFDDEQVYGRLYHIIWRWTSLWTFVSYHLTMNKSMDVCIISFDDEQVYRHLTICIISFDDEQVYGRLYHTIWKDKEIYKNIVVLMGGFRQLRVKFWMSSASWTRHDKAMFCFRPYKLWKITDLPTCFTLNNGERNTYCYWWIKK